MSLDPPPEASGAARSPGVCLSIAGLGVWIESPGPGFLEGVRSRYQKYLLPGPVHLNLEVIHRPDSRAKRNPEPAAEFFEGGISFKETAFRGDIKPRDGQAQLLLRAPDPLPDLEYFLRVIYAMLAFDAGGVLFHSAGILRQGRAYLFFGPSGTGKTTVARSVDPGMVLNDDLVVLLPEKGLWTVFATPFWNPSQVVPTGPQQGPLEGLFRLVQSQATYLEPLGRGQAVAELVANTPVVAANPAQGLALLARAQALSRAVAPQRLHLRLGDDLWPVIAGAG